MRAPSANFRHHLEEKTMISRFAFSRRALVGPAIVLLAAVGCVAEEENLPDSAAADIANE